MPGRCDTDAGVASTSSMLAHGRRFASGASCWCRRPVDLGGLPVTATASAWRRRALAERAAPASDNPGGRRAEIAEPRLPATDGRAACAVKAVTVPRDVDEVRRLGQAGPVDVRDRQRRPPRCLHRQGPPAAATVGGREARYVTGLASLRDDRRRTARWPDGSNASRGRSRHDHGDDPRRDAFPRKADVVMGARTARRRRSRSASSTRSRVYQEVKDHNARALEDACSPCALPGRRESAG